MSMNNHTSHVWFVGRHQGSADWIRSQNIAIDKFVPHLDEQDWPKAGDTVIGTLPVHIVARLNHQGVRFIHLKLDLDNMQRGIELSADDVSHAHPELTEYLVMQVSSSG